LAISLAREAATLSFIIVCLISGSGLTSSISFTLSADPTTASSISDADCAFTLVPVPSLLPDANYLPTFTLHFLMKFSSVPPLTLSISMNIWWLEDMICLKIMIFL